ncbi:hypothetical protein B4376_13280 [Shigella flexneri 1a]|nr:hypothetical protein BS654_11795 [Shigella flexneri 4c]ASQ63132.1 hypothetical protein BS647_16130 [Shigella flexneri 1a]EFW1581130.1 hypothetical protein [Shigella flexneri]EGJ87668.1 hypothetical protein SF274771_2272 [Shigella flexneri 2747-71]EIQ08813.1 hypothetical protein SF285071_2242 [Shigella flexneri 2850-71]OUZ55797.1 hypothetical protein CBL27_24325 [Shigella sonnei]
MSYFLNHFSVYCFLAMSLRSRLIVRWCARVYSVVDSPRFHISFPLKIKRLSGWRCEVYWQ